MRACMYVMLVVLGMYVMYVKDVMYGMYDCNVYCVCLLKRYVMLVMYVCM